MTDESFHFETSVQVRLRDLDPMEHVNNGVIATYLEQAREAYFRAVIEKSLLGNPNTVTARAVIEYEAPIPWDTEAVTVGVRIPEVGETSLLLEYEVRVDGVVAATGETVQVVYDVDAEAPRPVPDAWRERIESYESP